MSVERVEHLKSREDAIIFDDLSFQKLFLEGKGDSVLDIGLSLMLSCAFAVLPFYEEKICNMQQFLNTMPFEKKTEVNKKHWITAVSAFWKINLKDVREFQTRRCLW